MSSPSARVLKPLASTDPSLSKPVPPIFHFLGLPPEVRVMVYRCLLLQPYAWWLDRGHTVGIQRKQAPIYIDILRVNRQVNGEASHLMYSELDIIICPGDIAGLRSSEDLAKPTPNTWRHNPLHGIGSPDPHGSRVYATPELDGMMEPHISRFKNVSLQLIFDFSPGEPRGFHPLFIDSKLNINPRHIMRFSKFLR
ncbi:hypothetical protein N431DRAFT_474787 [Stipitochalara longipes BDJ]|nr:hypothetical protein N431DRAFT_474787 [Stipitochalara longipes BDJ]